MASDDFNSASPDKQYLRVYPLNINEKDIFIGDSVERDDVELQPLPDTGKEQYFVINKDGSGEIVAADPADMESEFQGNVADLSVSALETRFENLQKAFFEYGHLINPPYEGTSHEGILPEDMLGSLSAFQSEVDALRQDAGRLESSMIVLDDDPKAAMDTNREKADFLVAAIKEAEIVAPLIEDSYHLIAELEGERESTLTGEQYDQLHETVFGVNDGQDHSLPSYAKG